MKKTIILGLMLIILAGCSLTKGGGKNVLGLEAAKAKAESFINNNLMAPGTQATIKEATEEPGLYKFVIDLGNGQTLVSYLTRDGEKFFPQVMDIAEIEEQTQERQAQEAAAGSQTVESVKSDKPKVELFVMSHCPYGTQIEKGLLSVAETLGDSIDFALKFCDYAMHGKKELDEELQQYCIQKEQPDKFTAYLSCFLENEDSLGCLTTADVSAGKLNTCITATDKEFKITEKFNDQSTWSGGRYPVFDVYKADNEKYGVQGSPTLVINGVPVSSDRDSASLLSAICSAFNNPPAACGTKLSSDTPSPGFGFSGSGSGSGGQCE